MVNQGLSYLPPLIVDPVWWPITPLDALYALNNDLASGKTIPRWSPHARLGINTGYSPNHARNVNLVLNLENGLVSPQFHVKYDDFFETTRFNQAEATTSSPWRKLANLKADVDSLDWSE